jgi:hypothetical protein
MRLEDNRLKPAVGMLNSVDQVFLGASVTGQADEASLGSKTPQKCLDNVVSPRVSKRFQD